VGGGNYVTIGGNYSNVGVQTGQGNTRTSFAGLAVREPAGQQPARRRTAATFALSLFRPRPTAS
jgi:hypothetical protein